MNITLYNYEEYAIDFLENNLSSELMIEFKLFLQSHPEIKEEMQFVNSIETNANTCVFPEKENLYWQNTISNSPTNDKLIAYLENDLNKNDRNKLKFDLENDKTLNNQLKLFKKTKLKANISITYKEKNKLYRKIIFINQQFIRLAAAAAIILIAIIPVLFNNSTNKGKKINSY
ncbi:MAG: hypothetical protein KAI79_05945, partial [Bacteroidales bacterium]|nr:hypothetical protein [Bacteroidales bacterium]